MGVDPSQLIELGGSVAAVAAADETGLLDSLAQSGSPEEHAERLGLDPSAVALVLDTLVALGVAGRAGGRVAVSEPFAAAAGTPLAALLPMRRLWRHLPRFLMTGEPYAQMDGSPAERAAEYRDLAAALGGLFQPAAEELAAKLSPASGQILDVGAGSGVWSLAMCVRSPASRVTALDLPDVLPAFGDRAEQLGLADRIDTIPGDFHEAVLGGTFRRIVLANVLHLERPEPAASLVHRAAAALEPGGDLVVVDCFRDDDPARQTAYAVYALHLAMRTRTGRVHARAEVERWAREAGLSAGTGIRLHGRPWNVAALVHRRASRGTVTTRRRRCRLAWRPPSATR
jgi:2-polyprenyl-3-methyl-5-hydroxy-6-metoxy-1,4-benzoquinol methylase